MRRRFSLILAGNISLLILSVSVISLPEKLIWNRTDSAPIGLYWLSDGPLTLSGWAVVSAEGADAQWAEQRGYVGPDWPLIKRVRGQEGDEICRKGAKVSINGGTVAIALLADNYGRKLPAWSGGLTLGPDEYFLLNDHPRSLDGRYFGATKRRDIAGSARLIWKRS